MLGKIPGYQDHGCDLRREFPGLVRRSWLGRVHNSILRNKEPLQFYLIGLASIAIGVASLVIAWRSWLASESQAETAKLVYALEAAKAAPDFRLSDLITNETGNKLKVSLESGSVKNAFAEAAVRANYVYRTPSDDFISCTTDWMHLKTEPRTASNQKSDIDSFDFDLSTLKLKLESEYAKIESNGNSLIHKDKFDTKAMSVAVIVRYVDIYNEPIERTYIGRIGAVYLTSEQKSSFTRQPLFAAYIEGMRFNMCRDRFSSSP